MFMLLRNSTRQEPMTTRNAKQAKRRRAVSRKPPLGRDAWLRAGRDALIREGITGVEINKLARTLRVTRGGFYYFFPSRQRLLDELIKDWEHTNTAGFEAVLQDPGHNGIREFNAVVEMWVSERNYSPAWDVSVRNWARSSEKVAAAVRRVDDRRIAVLKQVFLDFGYPETVAFVRARISYFHQVGYYTLGVKEPSEQRQRLLPYYIEILTGYGP
jgi:AcrR family transcriptional regulator